MNKQLIERLRTLAEDVQRNYSSPDGDLIDEAADEFERIDAERGKGAVGFANQEMTSAVMKVSNSVQPGTPHPHFTIPLFLSLTITKAQAKGIKKVTKKHVAKPKPDPVVQQTECLCCFALTAERNELVEQNGKMATALRKAFDAIEAFTDQEGNMPEDTGEFRDLKAALVEVGEAIPSAQGERNAD